jgi:hypothetical protein
MDLAKKAKEERCFVRGRTQVGVSVLRKVGVEEEAVSFRYLKMSNPHYGKWECDLVFYPQVVDRKDQKEAVQIVFGVEYSRKTLQ